MNFEVLTCREQRSWNSLLEMIPIAGRSPHFTPEYHQLFEARGEGRGLCFVGTEKDRVIVYPTLIRSVNEAGFELDGSYYDIQGAYGYNGPATNCDDPDFLGSFSRRLCEYCQTTGIIAEFVRFCPVIGNHGFLSHIQPIHALDNVLIDLTPGLDALWKNSFDNGVRKAVRKAQQAGLDFHVVAGEAAVEDDIDCFLAVYNETMSRNSAGAYYFFSKAFITALCAALPGQILLVSALLAGRAISTELVLYNTHHAYGFLGGTLADHYALNPNSFLRYELIRHLIQAGVKAYSIGGGKTRGDSIYRFKKSFGRVLESKFYIGTHVHDERIYREVVAQWSRKFPEKVEPFKKFLLKYRY